MAVTCWRTVWAVTSPRNTPRVAYRIHRVARQEAARSPLASNSHGAARPVGITISNAGAPQMPRSKASGERGRNTRLRASTFDSTAGGDAQVWIFWDLDNKLPEAGKEDQTLENIVAAVSQFGIVRGTTAFANSYSLARTPVWQEACDRLQPEPQPNTSAASHSKGIAVQPRQKRRRLGDHWRFELKLASQPTRWYSLAALRIALVPDNKQAADRALRGDVTRLLEELTSPGTAPTHHAHICIVSDDTDMMKLLKKVRRFGVTPLVISSKKKMRALGSAACSWGNFAAWEFNDI
ncbi:hypothetical protein CYMTET_19127 [Cymbomonas tetramitiformis]|uniref:NYN domain-containing protein n=1 Tax=Cymbomonas tetramitiformis TaxID=36881 RepID=A0AAE0G6T0_9CHLO|nr:hypothetical protein CYMTET_19127 [Cymbomonas tetramitiformis]